VIFGKLELKSPYLWSKGKSSKPLVKDMGIKHQGRSETVERALVDFGSEEAFSPASKRFKEHYKYDIGTSAVSRVTEETAKEVIKYVEGKLSEAGKNYGDVETSNETVKEMLVELDGCEIRTAELKIKENGAETTPVYHNPKKEKIINWRDVRIGFARPLNEVSKIYVGKMSSYPEIVEQLFNASILKGMSPKTNVIGVADGGIGLAEELKNQFTNMQFILDKPHLKHHLYETAEELGITKDERAAWVNPRLKAISNGDVGRIWQELKDEYARSPKKRLKRLIGYIDRFFDAVNYKDFKEKGYPIGSGEVESAHKSVPQKRMKLPGACWHPDTINPMLALRVLRANDWWDDFWKERTEDKIAA
jgi:hypothetical protein